MRPTIALLTTAAIGLLALAGPAWTAEGPLVTAHPDSSSWPALFAPDLSDADFPKGVWTIVNDELTASQDQVIWTKRDHENFIVDLEFKDSVGTNSGVLVYCTDPRDWIPNTIEVQLLDDYADRWKDVAPTWKCGGIFGRLAPAKQVVKKAGEWNRVTVACKGPHLTVLLNDTLTVDADIKRWTSASKNPDGSDTPPFLARAMADMATKGRIGLQGKHGDAPVFFRNYRIGALN